MKNISIGLISLLLIACNLLNNSESSSKERVSNNLQNENKEYKHWSISKLSDSLSTLKSNQLAFMEENSMKGTYVELKKGESFKRKTVTDDIYYLYSGSCSANLANVNQSFDEGDVIFAKKGSDFMIDNSKEPLQIVIVSMTLASNSKSPNWKHFSKSDIESSRISDGNQWNPFIMYNNFMLGMYMLPHLVDGDDRLVHEWQELNILTAGSSKFVMDAGTIDVEKGSIFFVEEGNGHYFNSLSEDIDILILWEQRDVDHAGH